MALADIFSSLTFSYIVKEVLGDEEARMDSLNPQKITQAVAYIEKWLDINFRQSAIPGLQVAIQHEDTLVYSGAFGYSDIETETKLTPAHALRVASHSKTFTATALMQLVEAGKIHLDDTVSQYVDWFHSSKDDRVAKVTIRQLLNHTAGVIRDGLDSNYWQADREFPKEDELRKFVSKSTLVYESDTRFKYSNYGYGFLGFVIEAVSGQSYRAYVTKNIINKLGLKSTAPDLDDKGLQLLTKGYGRELFRRERKAFPQIDTQALSAATGFYSTAEEMCHYISAHFLGNTTLISDVSKRQMQHGYWDTKDDGEQYGLGMISYPRRGWEIYGHSGGFPGFISNTQFDASKKLVVSVLANTYDCNATMIAKKLINIIDTFQQDTDSIQLPVKDLTPFEGTFYSSWGPMDIIAVGKKLFSISPLNWGDFEDAETLEVKDASTLLIKEAGGYYSPGELIKYTFDSDGKALSIDEAGRTFLPYDEALKKGWF